MVSVDLYVDEWLEWELLAMSHQLLAAIISSQFLAQNLAEN
jgi:hypothetical protein